MASVWMNAFAAIERHQIARALGGMPGRGETVTLRPDLVERLQIHDRLREKHARVEHVERTDDARERLAERKPECLEVGLPPRQGRAGRDIGQQLGQRDRARAGRPLGALLGQQETQVVAQCPLDDIRNGEGDALGDRVPVGHAAGKRTVGRQGRPELRLRPAR